MEVETAARYGLNVGELYRNWKQEIEPGLRDIGKQDSYTRDACRSVAPLPRALHSFAVFRWSPPC